MKDVIIPLDVKLLFRPKRHAAQVTIFFQVPERIGQATLLCADNAAKEEKR